MPKRAKELTAIEVKRLTKDPGYWFVGGVSGLLLQVKDSGAASWILRVVVGNRRPEIGLGAYPGVTLEAAREEARAIRKQIAAGEDPLDARRKARDQLKSAEARRLTFDEAATAFLRNKANEFRSAKHAKQWKTTLDTHASPVIGSLPVADVELAHIVKVLEPIWTTINETASRVRGRIENVIDWAIVSGYRPKERGNPAQWKGNLAHVLPRRSKVRKVEHHAALPWTQLGAFMAKLRKREGMAARALEFAILTWARSGEVRLATWDEIDLAKKLWTVPAERMKAGKKHRVPLADPAVKLLKALPRMQESPYVFWAPRGGALSDMALAAVVRRIGVAAVPHGFRSTAKDWARTSTAYPDEVSELALAHVADDKTRAAYARDELLPQRTRLMREWARFCAVVPKKASVTPIRGRKS